MGEMDGKLIECLVVMVEVVVVAVGVLVVHASWPSVHVCSRVNALGAR